MTAKSKLTSQCQVSVPAEVRRRLGVGPGSVIEWVFEGDHALVRRSGSRSFEDIHRVLFPDGPPERRSVEEMDDGIRKAVRTRLRRARR